uniref:ribulose-phosphate 3-epimerase n=1 Tax=Ilyobacter sp. TaxID=3100343 RepID=UPI003562D6E7
RTIQRIHAAGMQAGVTLNPHTPVELLEDIICDVDMVLLMSVNPGFGGQTFIPSTIKKIKEVREIAPTVDIQIDGGITDITIKPCIEAGANIFVAGSFVFGGDYKEQIEKLRG